MFGKFKEDLVDFCVRHSSRAVRFTVDEVPTGLRLRIEHECTIDTYYECTLEVFFEVEEKLINVNLDS